MAKLAKQVIIKAGDTHGIVQREQSPSLGGIISISLIELIVEWAG